MSTLEVAWKKLANVCFDRLSMSFGPVDWAAVENVELPPDVARMWSSLFPRTPVAIGWHLFPTPLRVGELAADSYWPSSWVLLNDWESTGHFVLYLHPDGAVRWLMNDVEWDDSEVGRGVVLYPTLAAFIEAVANTVALTGSSFIETRVTKGLFRRKEGRWLAADVCARLVGEWSYDGFSPLLLSAVVDDQPLEGLGIPAEYAATFRQR